MCNKKYTKKIILLVFGLLGGLSWINFYFWMPTLNFTFIGIWIYIFLLLAIIYLGMYFIIEENSNTWECGNNVKQKWIQRKKKFEKTYKYVGLIPFLFLLYVFVTTAPMFHSEKYRTMIEPVKIVDLKQDNTLKVSLTHIRVIDEDNAKLLGDKKLGEKMGLGSQYIIGDYHIQKVKDELFWIAPLEYKGIFKWLGDHTGTPGYVMVSAQNSKNVNLVLNVDGKDLHMKYLDSAFLYENIERHIYTHGYNNVGITDFTFEVDDNLNPYFVVSIYEHKVGFSGADVNGVLVVNVQNGNIKKYSLKNLPKWIDRVQPEGIVKTQLNDRGLYINGWLNSLSIFEQKDVSELTDGAKLVYGNDNNAYWYSGLTSIGKDNSIIGFMLTNARTKDTFFYKQSGATENAAMRSAEGKVQEKHYKATFPSLYLIEGVPTYVMTLKDNEGLVKLFAMVSVEKYEIVGVGETLRSALRNYKSVMYSQGNTLQQSNYSLKVIKNKIIRIGSNTRGGMTYYYIVLEGDKHIYVANSNVSDELPLSEKSDIIKIKIKGGKNKIIDLLYFDNLNL